ncbi:TadE/TadG family type IV pilus assembly protein [Gemmatimonas sp.]|uniref:TadE/TadG family type IV pilus assembly protein n=1 Tax=Gemmatimonas sp. TaxID=1962908 RepID=UPI00286DD2DE|nr:TadE/TadG family type IV pilus assembly protein [Gemmatimonas sp.]
MKRSLRRFLREHDAGPIVEFAVVVPVLLLLLFGIVDFAQAFGQRNNLVAAVREGARFAASSSDPCNDQVRIRKQVTDYFVNVTGNSLPVVPTIAFTPVNVCSGATPRNLESVMVCVRNYPVNSTISKLTKRALVLQASAVFRWEQAPSTIADSITKC